MTKNSLWKIIQKCNDIKQIKQIHAQLLTSGEFLNHIRLCKITSFFFNSLITSYSSTKTPDSSPILVYKHLVKETHFLPDLYTIPVLLKSCSKIFAIKEGKQLHGVVLKMGILSPFDLYVQNSLLHFYSVCGSCVDASKLFDEMLQRDVVSWTGLISGYVKAGFFNQALSFFSKMDVEPNIATLVSVLVACGRVGNLCMGIGLHGWIFKSNYSTNLVVGNALMDMYVKCKSSDDARRVFDELGDKIDVVSWTCIINGLVQCDRSREALEFFDRMQVLDVVPDKVTLASVLGACASLGAIDQGKWIHEYIERNGIEWDDHIVTSMVDMYAKCGCIELALKSFNRRYKKNNIVIWNSLLGGLAMHGYVKEALDYFEEMVKLGVSPNEVTLLAILSACCHSGLVEEGCKQFSRMETHYNLSPSIEHYGCMVDLLGRSGCLNEAQKLIKNMPMEPDVLMWGSLLSSCKEYGNVEMSKDIERHLLEFEKKFDEKYDSGVYVMLSNIYASNDKWEEVTKIRKIMKKKGIKKSPGSSIVEVDGKATKFVNGDDIKGSGTIT